MPTSLDYSSLESHPRWRNLPPPPGFASGASSRTPARSPATVEASNTALKEKRAWDLAVSPAKQLPMQALMLYMSGGGVQIFSIGIIVMLFVSPFKNLAALHSTFAPFAPSKSVAYAPSTLPLQKIVYILCNALTLALGLWKCRSMGLLPMGTGDWLAFEMRGSPPELVLY